MKAVIRFATIAVVVIGLAVFAFRVSAANGPVAIPKEGEGYQITKTNSSQMAPSGFEGRTDTSTQTAVGITPATMGKRVVSHFTLSNKIKTCPAADGTAEGEGVFAITVDSTDAQASGTSTIHIDMRAKATYKGQVNDDAYLDGPVKAEIDYTYTSSGSIRGANGAIATPAGSNVAQHITIQFLVGPAMSAPSFGAFDAGDPTQGSYSEAFSVGTALSYWAGVYYSVAQTKWRTGQCVKVSFNPPSNSVQPALGTEATVKGEVKTKSGEVVPAKFFNVHGFVGSGISPFEGRSNVGSPLTFTYRAPTQKSNLAGFQVDATSRAGIAEEEWHTNLGTGWSGQISCSRVFEGDVGNTEPQFWSVYTATRLTIDLKDGAGTVNGYTEINNMTLNLRPVARQGNVYDNNSSMKGIAEGTARATVVVTFDESRRTYSIGPEYPPWPPTKEHASTCDHQNGCLEQDLPFYVQSCLPPGGHLEGPLTNRNELHGSTNDVKTGLGRSRQGTETWNVTWHLARQGTSQ